MTFLRAAEGACRTHNGRLNAQAKGLTSASDRLSQRRSLLERGCIKYSPPKEQTRIVG
jgi:hypothetical protein